MSVDLFTAIEQARARGETPARTATVLGCTLGDVQRVYARMDALVSDGEPGGVIHNPYAQPCAQLSSPGMPVKRKGLPMTPGEAALVEAARIETARIYSRLCPEHHSSDDFAEPVATDMDAARVRVARARAVLKVIAS